MGTVVIGSTSYTVYGEHAGADSLAAYAAGSLAFAATFSAATDDDQKRTMIEVARIFRAQDWNDDNYGDPTYASMPPEIIEGSYLYALAGLADPAIFTMTSTAKNIKRVNAKGAEVEFFAPTSGGRWPGRVAELVGQFLAGMGGSASGPSGSTAYGTSCESEFDDCDRYGVTGPG